MDSIWREIRDSHYDDIENKIYIDAWRTGDGDESGDVIATVDAGTGDIQYLDDRARNDPYAQEVIGHVQREVEDRAFEQKD